MGGIFQKSLRHTPIKVQPLALSLLRYRSTSTFRPSSKGNQTGLVIAASYHQQATPINTYTSSTKLCTLQPRLDLQVSKQSAFLFSSQRRRMATKLPKIPDIAKLSTSVIAVLGGNPNKFTLQGSNTYVLGTGPNRLLIDTAQGIPVWKKSLSQVLAEENATISNCILTHWHGDHVGGVPDFQSLCPEAPIWKGSGNDIDPDQQLTNVNVKVIDDGATFTDNNGFEIEAVYCPGHTQDHMAFIITKSTDESEIGAMFTADNVLGHGTAVFENLAQYLRSLDLMKSRLHRKARAYPGHGVVIEDAQAKIEEYIAHRKMREDEALNVLRYGAPKKPALGKENATGKEWGSMEMVKVIYWDVPEHLHEPAEKGLLMVLAKLKGEGRVIETNGKWKMGEKATL